MITLNKNSTEQEVHRSSRGRTLVLGVRAYEKFRDRPEADRVIIVDRRLPPTTCQRLSHREFVCGGVQFALEVAGGEAVLFCQSDD
jgi:hypothetical protein